MDADADLQKPLVICLKPARTDGTCVEDCTHLFIHAYLDGRRATWQEMLALSTLDSPSLHLVLCFTPPLPDATPDATIALEFYDTTLHERPGGAAARTLGHLFWTELTIRCINIKAPGDDVDALSLEIIRYALERARTASR